MADATDSQLIATLGGLDEQWSVMSPARIRILLRQHGFIVSEKRAKALKAETLRSRVEVERVGSQFSGNSRDMCASCSGAAALHCSRCTRVKYCSKECQRNHWKAHRPSCAPQSKPSAASTSAAPTCPICGSAWAGCKCEADEKPSCWVCLESNGILLRGCACRGSAGYPHAWCFRILRHVSMYMQVCARVLHCGGEQAPPRRAPYLPDMQAEIRGRTSDGCGRGTSAHYSLESELRPCSSEWPCWCAHRQGQLSTGS